jgi:uncharacterized protein with von Willebrand factor type A (vWA) domain
VPDASSSGSHLLANLILFARILRGAGVTVTSGQILTLVKALDHLDLGQRRQVKDAARAVLVSRREQREVFDRLFDLFWKRRLSTGSPLELGQLRQRGRRSKARVLAYVPGEGGLENALESEHTVLEARRTYSSQEILRRKDFAELSAGEVEEVRRLLHRDLLRLEPRRTRRFEGARRGESLDLRRALRRSLRWGGEALELPRRTRRLRERPLVVLADISGSMEPYSRMLLELLWTLKATHRSLEAFVFGTRLTRISRELGRRDPDRALGEATAAVVDWGGGTRIGEVLRHFHLHWGKRVLGQGAVVLVISDGWDRGEPQVLERQVARLARGSWRLLWLNPLLGSPGYEPLTRGIQAVLPHLDHFLPVHNLESLGQLAKVLEELEAAPRGRLQPVGTKGERLA